MLGYRLPPNAGRMLAFRVITGVGGYRQQRRTISKPLSYRFMEGALL